MITPKFKLEQDDEQLTATIHAPFGSLKDAEVYVDNDCFTFWAKPYLLKIKLPKLVEVDAEGVSAIFDADLGDFIIKLKKATPGELFPNLDFLTTLKLPKNHKPGSDVGKAFVEVVADKGKQFD
jgi:protein SHQ1